MSSIDPGHPYIRNLVEEMERRRSYCEVWRLETIPDDVIYAEAARRRVAKRGYRRSCECGECQKCKTRLWMANYRKNKAAGKVKTRSNKKTPAGQDWGG